MGVHKGAEDDARNCHLLDVRDLAVSCSAAPCFSSGYMKNTLRVSSPVPALMHSLQPGFFPRVFLFIACGVYVFLCTYCTYCMLLYALRVLYVLHVLYALYVLHMLSHCSPFYVFDVL